MADFLDETFPEVTAETPVVETPEAAVETPEVVATPEPVEPAPEPTPQAEVPPKDERVPLATYLDTRDRAKKAEARAAELEAKFSQQPAAPSPFDDPDGYFSHQQQLVETRLTEERFAMSDMFARQQHGEDTVEKAVVWAQERAAADPAFAMTYMRERNPIDWIVRQHRQDDLIKQIGEDPDAFVLRRYAELNPIAGAVAPVAAAQPAPKPAPPPRSIAAESGNGSASVADDPRAEFLSIFDKKVG